MIKILLYYYRNNLNNKNLLSHVIDFFHIHNKYKLVTNLHNHYLIFKHKDIQAFQLTYTIFYLLEVFHPFFKLKLSCTLFFPYWLRFCDTLQKVQIWIIITI